MTKTEIKRHLREVQIELARERQRTHAKKRAWLRYRLELDDEDLAKLADIIKRGRAKYVRRHSRNATEWLAFCRGWEVRVLYDIVSHQIGTFLPIIGTTRPTRHKRRKRSRKRRGRLKGK